MDAQSPPGTCGAFRAEPPSLAQSCAPGAQLLLKFRPQSPNWLADRPTETPQLCRSGPEEARTAWLFWLLHPGLSKHLTSQDCTLSPSRPGLGREMGLPGPLGHLNSWRGGPREERSGARPPADLGWGWRGRWRGGGIVDAVYSLCRCCAPSWDQWRPRACSSAISQRPVLSQQEQLPGSEMPGRPHSPLGAAQSQWVSDMGRI